VRLRRVDNGARSRVTRAMGNWWRNRRHPLQLLEGMVFGNYETFTTTWQMGEIARSPRSVMWHFRLITSPHLQRCASTAYDSHPPLHKPLFFLAVAESRYKVKEAGAILHAVPGLQFQAQLLASGMRYHICTAPYVTLAHMDACTPQRLGAIGVFNTILSYRQLLV
jgi:hypothetical protein